jgi:hypothetical protein
MTALALQTTAAIALVWVATATTTTLGHGQPTTTPAQIVKTLASGSHRDRADAIDHVERSEALLRDLQVRRELVRELERTNQARLARYTRSTAPAGSEPREPGDEGYDLQLIRLVASFDDQSAARALAEASDTGSVAWNALARLGDPGVHAVHTAWQAKGRPELAATLLRSGLLCALRVAAEQAQLTGATRPTTVVIARAAIERPDNAGVLEAANDLALALKEEVLVDQVRRMSVDLAEIQRRGIKDVDAAERVQRLARESLAKKR